jgi:hypothetical protein
MTRTMLRWEAASGAAFSVVAFVAFLLALGPSDDSGQGLVSYYAEHTDAVRLQALCFGVAAILLIWFAATLATAARAADAGNRSGTVLLVAAASTVAVYLVGVCCWLALAGVFRNFTGTSDRNTDGIAFTLKNLADAVFEMSNFTAAAFVAGAALALVTARLAARWIGWLGAVLAAFLVVQGCVQVLSESDFADTLGTVAFVAFLVWVLAASVLFARTVAHEPAGAGVPSAA